MADENDEVEVGSEEVDLESMTPKERATYNRRAGAARARAKLAEKKEQQQRLIPAGYISSAEVKKNWNKNTLSEEEVFFRSLIFACQQLNIRSSEKVFTAIPLAKTITELVLETYP